MNRSFFIFLLLFAKVIDAQVIKTDSSVSYNYSSFKYAPRVTFGYQKSIYYEVGICREVYKSYDNYELNKYGKDGVLYFGTFLTYGNLVVKNKSINSIKLGFETILAGGSYGLTFGLDLTDYFYNSNQYLAVTPRFVIPLTKEATPLAFISYGYSINSFNSLSEYVGNHQFMLTLNLFYKEHKRINSIREEFQMGVENLQAKYKIKN